MGDSIIRGQESSWATYANNLTGIFQKQYGAQSAIFQQLTSRFTDMVNNPQGFSPAALSALKGGLVGNIATQFNNARQGIGATQAARGDFQGDVKSGVNAQIQGQLAGQQAGATASGLDEIEQQNEQQKIQNQRLGLSGLEGVAQGLNPTGFSGAANSAANTVGSLGSQYFATDQNGLGQALQDGFGKAMGAGMSALATGGAGKMVGSSKQNNNNDNGGDN